MPFAFPDLIERHLVTDAAFGAAYDAVSPEERAVLKTAIARMAASPTKAAPILRHSVTMTRQGVSLHEQNRPAPWALVLWDAAHAGPTRILAALMPAMLAGVPNILVCRVTADESGKTEPSGPFPLPLLTALELAGQELAAECDSGTALHLVNACCEADPHGRLVLLGSAAVLDDAARVAASFGVPAYRNAAPVRIGVAASSFSGPVGDDALRFVHPDADLVSFAGDAAPGGFSAVFCAGDRVADFLGTAPLVLSPGNEGYWAWPALDAGFFRETNTGLSGMTEQSG